MNILFLIFCHLSVVYESGWLFEQKCKSTYRGGLFDILLQLFALDRVNKFYYRVIADHCDENFYLTEGLHNICFQIPVSLPS